jgi:hypothetical protein
MFFSDIIPGTRARGAIASVTQGVSFYELVHRQDPCYVSPQNSKNTLRTDPMTIRFIHTGQILPRTFARTIEA